MKLRLLSDLHLEFAPWEIPHLEGDEDTTLILAGDIGMGTRVDTWKPFVEDACEQFKHVIYIPGNHEYYRGTFLDTWQEMSDSTIDILNLYMLDMDRVTLDGITFMGTTLWTDMDAKTQFTAQWGMNDYHLIKLTDGNTLTTMNTIHEHHAAVMWLENQFMEGETTVVVTHHGPSPQSITLKYEGDDLNQAYMTDLEDKILEWKPALWLHGHIHNSVDYMVGDTRVIANPKGYPTYKGPENEEFLPEFSLELTPDEG